MDFVTIKHPDPEVGDAQVPESAVDVWRKSGWLTEQEYATAELPAKPAPAEEAPKPIKPAARGRRTTEEKD